MNNKVKISLLALFVSLAQGCSLMPEKDDSVINQSSAEVVQDQQAEKVEQRGGKSRPGIYAGAGQKDALKW